MNSITIEKAQENIKKALEDGKFGSKSKVIFIKNSDHYLVNGHEIGMTLIKYHINNYLNAPN